MPAQILIVTAVHRMALSQCWQYADGGQVWLVITGQVSSSHLGRVGALLTAGPVGWCQKCHLPHGWSLTLTHRVGPIALSSHYMT